MDFKVRPREKQGSFPGPQIPYEGCPNKESTDMPLVRFKAEKKARGAGRLTVSSNPEELTFPHEDTLSQRMPPLS